MVERADYDGWSRFGVFAAGIFAWIFALALTRDVDFAVYFSGVPYPWRQLVTAPFRPPFAHYCLALTGGLGMVMLVSEAPQRLRVYGALLAFTAPMYAAARMLAAT